MSYRQAADKHRCKYDEWEHRPPHFFIRRCSCGAYEPLSAIDRALTLVLRPVFRMMDAMNEKDQ